MKREFCYKKNVAIKIVDTLKVAFAYGVAYGKQYGLVSQS